MVGVGRRQHSVWAGDSGRSGQGAVAGMGRGQQSVNAGAAVSSVANRSRARSLIELAAGQK